MDAKINIEIQIGEITDKQELHVVALTLAKGAVAAIDPKRKAMLVSLRSIITETIEHDLC